jgi:hypothetical protein
MGMFGRELGTELYFEIERLELVIAGTCQGKSTNGGAWIPLVGKEI